MRKTSSITVALFGLCSIVGGCSADQGAQKLAGKLQRLTVAYDASLAKKVSAEQDFYSHQLNNLSYFYDGRPPSTTQPGPAGGNQFDPTLTVAFGRITIGSTSDATRLADQLATSDRPAVVSAIHDFLNQGIAADENAYLEAHAKRLQLSTDLLQGLTKLEVEEQKLRDIAKELSDLEAGPSADDRMKDVFSLGQAAIGALKSQNASPEK